MKKDEIIHLIAQELALLDGAWQAIEVRLKNSIAPAKSIVVALIKADCLKIDEEIEEQ